MIMQEITFKYVDDEDGIETSCSIKNSSHYLDDVVNCFDSFLAMIGYPRMNQCMMSDSLTFEELEYLQDCLESYRLNKNNDD